MNLSILLVEREGGVQHGFSAQYQLLFRRVFFCRGALQTAGTVIICTHSPGPGGACQVVARAAVLFFPDAPAGAAALKTPYTLYVRKKESGYVFSW